MSWHHLPNIISTLRLLLVPPVVWLILREAHAEALLLFLIAGVSDGIDGFLAKRFGWQSELGGILDPLADKLLVVAAVLALTGQGLIPLWLAAAIVLRDVVIVSGAVAYRLLIGPFAAAPTIISKLNTGVLILLVLAVLSGDWLDLRGQLWPLFALSFVLTLGSGADYVMQWARRAREAWRQQSRS